MSTRGITLVPGTIVVLSLDGTLGYVEDVQPTYAAIVALPEQLGERKTQVFTPGRVGAKKISPYSSADRTLEVSDLSARNQAFINDFEKLRTQHGPNFVARSPEEEAAMSVVKAGPSKRSRTPEDPAAAKQSKQEKRAKRRAAKVPCTKCGYLPVHANHHGGGCDYAAPAKAVRASRGGSTAAPSAAVDPTYTIISEDLTKATEASDKFKVGNRFYRVFRVLNLLPNKSGTLRDIVVALMQDGGRPMADAEKVARRALKQLGDSGNLSRA